LPDGSQDSPAGGQGLISLPILRIPERPDFRTGTIAEMCQNIDDKPPNFFYDYSGKKNFEKS
jgi:hypothetical protein